MTMTAVEVLQAIHADPKNLDNVAKYTTPDGTYVSLNYDHPELKRVMRGAAPSTGPRRS